jgi:hypothetical protein
MGGKWVAAERRHVCYQPSLFGLVINKQGLVWECECSRRYEIVRAHGVKEWRELPDTESPRRAVLDAVASSLLRGVEGEELARRRSEIHGVLTELERLGHASWATSQTP